LRIFTPDYLKQNFSEKVPSSEKISRQKKIFLKVLRILRLFEKWHGAAWLSKHQAAGKRL
jgi:hypothetical protein